MSKNRPKIWLNDTTYIYKSDYNMYKSLQEALTGVYQIDVTQSCRKFKTVDGSYVKRKPVYVVTNGEPGIKNCIITRIDCNEEDSAQQLQLENIENNERYTVDIYSKKLIKDDFCRSYSEKNPCYDILFLTTEKDLIE